MPEFNLDPLSNLNDPYGREREGQSRLYENYGQIAEYGVFGDEGISNIARGKGRAIALKRQALRKRLKNSIFRRLGPRAGGSADLIAANQIEAPAFAQMQEFMQDLRRQNELSKSTIGLAGRERAIGALNSLYLNKQALDQARDANKTGFLDWVNAGANVVGAFTGGGGSAQKQPVTANISSYGGPSEPRAGRYDPLVNASRPRY